MCFSADPGFDLQKTTNILTDFIFSLHQILWHEKKQNKPIRKISNGPQKTHFLPGMRYSEGKKIEEKQILLKLKTGNKPVSTSQLYEWL